MLYDNTQNEEVDWIFQIILSGVVFTKGEVYVLLKAFHGLATGEASYGDVDRYGRVGDYL